MLKLLLVRVSDATPRVKATATAKSIRSEYRKHDLREVQSQATSAENNSKSHDERCIRKYTKLQLWEVQDLAIAQHRVAKLSAISPHTESHMHSLEEHATYRLSYSLLICLVGNIEETYSIVDTQVTG